MHAIIQLSFRFEVTSLISHNTSTDPVFLLTSLAINTTAKIIAEYSQIENSVDSCVFLWRLV